MPRLSIYRCSLGWARGGCAIDWRRTFGGADCCGARAGRGRIINHRQSELRRESSHLLYPQERIDVVDFLQIIVVQQQDADRLRVLGLGHLLEAFLRQIQNANNIHLGIYEEIRANSWTWVKSAADEGRCAAVDEMQLKSRVKFAKFPTAKLILFAELRTFNCNLICATACKSSQDYSPISIIQFLT